MICADCRFGLEQVVDGENRVMCLFWRRLAHETCAEFDRKPKEKHEGE